MLPRWGDQMSFNCHSAASLYSTFPTLFTINKENSSCLRFPPSINFPTSLNREFNAVTWSSQWNVSFGTADTNKQWRHTLNLFSYNSNWFLFMSRATCSDHEHKDNASVRLGIRLKTHLSVWSEIIQRVDSKLQPYIRSVCVYIRSDWDDRARWLWHRKRQRVYNGRLPLLSLVVWWRHQFHPLITDLQLSLHRKVPAALGEPDTRSITCEGVCVGCRAVHGM